MARSRIVLWHWHILHMGKWRLLRRYVNLCWMTGRQQPWNNITIYRTWIYLHKCILYSFASVSSPIPASVLLSKSLFSLLTALATETNAFPWLISKHWLWNFQILHISPSEYIHYNKQVATCFVLKLKCNIKLKNRFHYQNVPNN